MITVPKLRAPIVLVHGLFGFNAVRAFGVELVPYFRGIRQYLAEPGNRVYAAGLSPTSRVYQRAFQLRRFIDRVSPLDPVHIIAHSMGGLDSRYMISHLGMQDRVLSLTTLGTPHRGTSFADWGMTRIGRIMTVSKWPFLRTIPALVDLTTYACKTFNEEVLDAPNVRYFSVGANFQGRWWVPNWWLSGTIIQNAEGDNDGLTSLISAKYGEAFDVWDGDHMSLVNWPTMQTTLTGWTDQRPGYAGLIRRLADLGF